MTGANLYIAPTDQTEVVLYEYVFEKGLLQL